MKNQNRRAGSLLLTLALLLGLCSPMGGLAPEAKAADTPKPAAPVLDDFLVPVSQAAQVPSGYTGIFTVDELTAISDAPNVDYILMADLDLSGLEWTSLCRDDDAPFTGTFDGNGHVISGLTGTNGLFYYTDGAVIQNLGLKQVTIQSAQTSDDAAGGLIATLLGDTEIRNCYVQGDLSSDTRYLGGIVGRRLGNGIGLTVENCWMAGDLISSFGSSLSNEGYVGGIAGGDHYWNPILTGCIHSGRIEATGNHGQVAGICGSAYSPTVTACQNYGSIVFRGSDADLSGMTNLYSQGEAVVDRCMNAADITLEEGNSSCNVSGLVGGTAEITNSFNCGDITVTQSDRNSYTNVSGIATDTSNAQNNYNVGQIIINKKNLLYAGSLFEHINGPAASCYCLDGDIPPYHNCYTPENLTNFTALTESQMQDASSYVGFDFSTVWTMGTGRYPYPVLRDMAGGTGDDEPLIPTPVLISAANEQEGVRLTWTRPLDSLDITYSVDGYKVLRKSGGGDYQVLADAGDSLSYLDQTAEEGVTYTYTVQAYYGDKTGGYDPDGLTVVRTAGGGQGGIDPADIPVPFLRTVRNRADGIEISWNSPLLSWDIPGLEAGYQILRRTEEESSYTQIGSVQGIDTLTYTDTGVTEGTNYIYTVRMFVRDETGGYEEEGLSILRSSILIQGIDFSGGRTLLPLKGSNMVLELEENGLSEYYLEDGVFTGSVRLTAGGEVLASVKPEYDAEYKLLSFALYPEADGYFPPNTDAEIQVLDRAGRVVAEISCKTSFQQWAATNFDTGDAALPRELIYLLLSGDESSGFGYSNKADQLIGKGIEPGKGGFCFGMALSVSLVNWSDVYQFQGYDILDETGTSAQVLSYTPMLGEYREFSATEFIQLCHLVQYLSQVQAEMNQNRWNYTGILKEIDRYKSGACPMPLAWIENTASGQSHTLGAFDYRLEGDDLYILCYDCNLAGTVKEIQVKDYQDADSASWSFVTLGWGGSQADAGLWADKNYFTYYAPDMGDDIFFYTEKARTDVLASVSSEEDLEQIQTTGTLQVTPISYLSSAEEADAPLLADANPFDGVKAWISGDGTLLLERLSPDGEITLADNTAAYHADAAASYAAALQNGAVDQVSAGGGALTLTCEYYAESGDNIAVTFTGAPDREGGSVTMKRENGAVVFQNAGADSSVTVVYQDTDGGAPDRTWTQTVSDGDTIRIEADGESAPVIKADGDDSGSDGGGDDTGDSGSGGGSSSGNQTTVEDSEGGTISVSKKNPSKGETVTITTDPEDGYEVDSILVTDRNGNPIAVTDNGDGTYSFVQPSGAVTIQPVFRPISAPVFDDVPSGAWYYGAVQWAVENGITSGTSSSTFSPDRPCTRGEVVTLLWRAMGEPEADASSCPFTDVQTGDYCYDAVLWAAESGITTGTSATSFSPGLVCTRAQVTALLWRAMGEPETQTDGNPFADVQAGDYYCKAVLWAVENGVTTGTSSAAFSPDTACTRAQAVTFLYRNFTK